MGKKFVYAFQEGSKEMNMLLGGKGANLCEMKRMELPVPDGFIVTTEGCWDYFENGNKIKDEIKKEITENLHALEKRTGRILEGKNPLLVSIRSGAPVSMPGMMDTILNLGFNDAVAERLIEKSGDEKFVYELYSRFVAMFSEIAMGMDINKFEEIKKKGIEGKELVTEYKKLYEKELGIKFPESSQEQMMIAVEAIFRSWNNERARVYRELNNIDDKMGTAVIVQKMVFGNMNDSSATGVAFTRNPSTGEKQVTGEYLIHAQGEDIVAGIRTPEPMEDMKNTMPVIYKEFEEASEKLEQHYKNMQDIEFTVEDGKLYILQTRNGKRTAWAAVKIAVDMVKEGLITEEAAILRIEPKSVSQVIQGDFDSKELMKAVLIGKGLPGSSGVASGRVILDSARVPKEGKSILVRDETSPEDIKGMSLAEGILTVRGGITSHGAVVARGMGKCCVTGCGDMVIDKEKRAFTLGGHVIKEGDYISISGYTGNIYLGEISISTAKIAGEFKEFLEMAAKHKRLGVRANADTPVDAAAAIEMGAEGIGLCRTEHMFFQEDRIWAVREMILADNHEDRKKALDKIMPMQKRDFVEMFKIMKDKPFTIRLLDPPLHEFLPKNENDIQYMAQLLKSDVEKVRKRVEALQEHNPMLGLRGCRLAVVYPEIYEMQAEAISKAYLECMEENITVKLEIMIPLTMSKEELKYVKEKVGSVIDPRVKYLLGTMIELPRACVTAEKIAEEAEFFSFGTNDLTQTTLGFSRDDVGLFIGEYEAKEIIKKDPFVTIDKEGVGKLVEMAAKNGKAVRKELEVGICGEHGGDPESVAFFNGLEIDYVSCSPYRVPISIISAAQAAVKIKSCK